VRTIRPQSSRSSLYCHAEWRCKCPSAFAIIFYVWEFRFLSSQCQQYSTIEFMLWGTQWPVLNAPLTCQSENNTRKLRKTWHVAQWIIISKYWNSDSKSSEGTMTSFLGFLIDQRFLCDSRTIALTSNSCTSTKHCYKLNDRCKFSFITNI